MRLRSLVISLVLVATSAHAADDRTRAKALFQEGMKHFNLGDYSEAINSFKQGYLAKPDPVFLFNLGQSYRMLGDAASSAREYRAYLREVPDAPNRKSVERFIAEAEEELRRRNATPGPLPLKEGDGAAKAAPAVENAPAPAAAPTLPAGAPAPSAPAPTPVAATEHPATDASLTATAPAPTPIYKKWWLWTAVAAVVVIAAAIGIGVAASGGQDAPVPSTTGGTYGVTF